MTNRAAGAAWLWVALTAAAVRGGDWPQILGPARTGAAAADEQLADTWPAAGPAVIWKRPVGAGYAGVAVVGGRAILFHREGDREIVEALDAATGKTLWQADQPTRFRPQVGGGDGPLCTPVVHAGTVITFGAQGVLAAHDLATGTRRWSRETHREFAAPEGYFGAGSTPLVMGDRVIVNVGGRGDAGIVACALDTGATLWQRTAEAASYSAPVALEVAGRPHVLMVTRLSCLLLDPVTGDVAWQFPFGQRGPTVNGASPVVIGGDRVLVTSAYGIGCVCAAFDRAAAKPAWQGEGPLASQYCTPVLVGDHLYCLDGRDDVPPAEFVCVEAATGREAWRERLDAYGTLVVADGKLVVAKTDGEVLLVRPDPKRLEVLARCRPLSGTVRALPALAGGRLYLRDDATLICLDVGR
ncbi:MAG: PQQ-binding-like beta-propeller repeat protein [Planctomycetaceae bacterium]